MVDIFVDVVFRDIRIVATISGRVNRVYSHGKICRNNPAAQTSSARLRRLVRVRFETVLASFMWKWPTEPSLMSINVSRMFVALVTVNAF